MGQRSPLVTLAAAAVGLVALLVVNSTQAPPPAPSGSAVGGAVAPATTTSPTPSPSSATPSTSPTVPKPSPAKQLVGVFAGRTRGREATLAIAVKGGRAAAYVCDGRRVEAWLTGTQTAGRLTLRSRAGERLAGILAGTTATGTVTLHGRTLRFTIGKAAPPAGLYRGRTSNSATIGWIVLSDGSQVGIDNDGTPGPAPPLDPQSGTATVDGATVTATSVTGDETF
jgi:hypothetical protein